MSVSLKQHAAILGVYLRPEWRKVTLLAVLLLSSIGLQLLNPQFLRRFIDDAKDGASTERMATTAMIFFGIAVVKQGLSVAASYLGEDVGWTATNRLRADLARHCLRLDMPFHNNRTPGEMIERIDGDVTALANFFSQMVIRVFGSFLLLIGAIVLLYREDWRVGLALTLFALLAVAMLFRTREIAVPPLTAEREATARVFGFVEERLSGIDDLRSRGAGDHVMRGLYSVMRQLFFRGRHSWMMGTVVESLFLALFAIGYLMSLSMGAYLFLTGAITIGTAYLFFQYTEMLREPIEQLTREMKELQKATAGIVRIEELLQTPRMIQDGTTASVPNGALSVTFDHVTFRYAPDAPVLEDVSFRLAPGRILGLLGRTGSGKTTIARMLFRLYEPQNGAVRIGDVDLRDVPINDARRRIAMVTQDVQLFNASVRDNLTFFDRSVSDNRLLVLLASLGLSEWLAGLPAGLDTPIRGGGSGLSAGESQLLAVARAFLTDPGLVILDEPSSRLDPSTEKLIDRALAQLLAGRTAIVIAHRLATVERADEILILENGHVREHGDRARLAADPTSRFSELLHIGMREALA